MKFGIIQHLILVIKTFGCTAYCLNKRPNHEFSARSKKGISVVYSDTLKAFHVYFPSKNRVIISRAVKLFEECSDNPSKVGKLQTKNFH